MFYDKEQTKEIVDNLDKVKKMLQAQLEDDELDR